ncbi:DUF2785 domain-containing protein [Jeotgalibacillus sp. R-1-5s-1]|uniref:DUF2785 domain-containing protein n=1 Tax=Jeotgalibacillus sp. R-1-5s-1 TaxID=2555897 RepID=UPI0010693584|nr:DUF2785 domain-containing protein [Jeotgalibacillus sp. R-1-5s-1]TFE00849.1 DUF2785 domain-containing protein [Jeotgalibacillus sp. R-1-5s-1]
MTEQELKEILMMTLKNKGELSDNLILHMITHIGSTDPVLRDELIYQAFGIYVTENRFSDSQLHLITEQLLTQKKLLSGINQSVSDDLFTRSFSALIFALLLKQDHERRFLSKDYYERIVDVVQYYVSSENDLRGYVPDKGWAHAAAHAADLLEAIALHPLTGDGELGLVIKGVAHFLTSAPGYHDEEEERLAIAFLAYTTRFELDGWLIDLQELIREVVFHSDSLPDLERYRVKTSLKFFLQALFFKIDEDSARSYLEHQIVNLMN